jgi:FkbM family methyltransferase
MPLSRTDFIPPLVSQFKTWLSRELLHQGSTGLNELDLRLIEAIAPIPSGYFVELGANDGLRHSNTYKLQRNFGWTGLLIEPSPRRFVECVANRAFGNRPEVRCAACVPFDFKDRFVEIEDADLMSVAKGLAVTDQQAAEHADRGRQFLSDTALRHSYGALARTLTSLLDEVEAPLGFDLLSLDVEGNELAVLQGLDLQRYKPKWILVETRGPEIAGYLTESGYQVHAKLSNYATYSDLLFARGS